MYVLLLLVFQENLILNYFPADATSCPEHMSKVEGVRWEGCLLQMEAECNEPDARKGLGGEARGKAVASGVVSKETPVKYLFD